MIGVLVRCRVRVKIRTGVRGTFNVSIYHWSICRRIKCRTFDIAKHNFHDFVPTV